MRNAKLLSSKKTVDADWIYPFDRNYESNVFVWGSAENIIADQRIEAEKALYSRVASTPNDKQKDVLKKENLKWLMEKNPDLSEKDALGVLTAIRNLLGYRRENEYALFAFYTINEFLAQDTYELYGEYLEARWDADYALMKSGFWHIHEESWKVSRAVGAKDSLLQHRPRSAPAIRAALDELTKEQIRKLLTVKEEQLSTKPSIMVEQLKTLLNGETEEQDYPLPPIENQLFVAFSKSVARAGTVTNFSHIASAELALKYINRLSRNFYENKAKAKPGQLSTSVLKKLAKTLELRANDFQPLEILAIIFSFTSPDGVVASPKLQALKLYAAIAKLSEDEAVQVFKLLAELTLSYRGRLPNLATWETYLFDGSLELTLSKEMMFDLMGGAAVLRAPTDGKDFSEFRREVRRS